MSTIRPLFERKYAESPFLKGEKVAKQIECKIFSKTNIKAAVKITGYDSKQITEVRLSNLSKQQFTTNQAEILNILKSRSFDLNNFDVYFEADTIRLVFKELGVSKNNHAKQQWPKCPFDYIEHHNQILDTVNVALKRKDIQKGAVYLHYDEHSDIYLNRKTKGQETIGSFVNTLMADNIISEMYWVVPDDSNAASSASAKIQAELFLVLERQPPYQVSLFLEPDGTAHKTPPLDAESYREVVVYVRRQSDLLKDKKLSNKSNIILSICGDYLSNRRANPSVEKLESQLNSFSNHLNANNIKPALLVFSASPSWAHLEDIYHVEKYFKKYYPLDYIENKVENYSYGQDICQKLIDRGFAPKKGP